NVHTIRAPEHPSGWPSAIAPPFTFVIAWRKPSSRMTVRAWIAKASFSSIRSRSSTARPARDNAFRVVGTGPRPFVRGSTPAVVVFAGERRGQVPPVLGGLAHGVVPVLGLEPRIRTPPSHRRAPRGQVSHAAVEVLRHRVRRPCHALDAAGHEHFAFAGLDGPRRGIDRREARRAETVEGQTRHGDWKTREERRHPGDVPVVLSRLVRTAEIHFV